MADSNRRDFLRRASFGAAAVGGGGRGTGVVAVRPTFPYLGTPNSGFATKPKNHDTGGGAGMTPAGGAGTGAGGTSTGRSTELLIGGAVAAAGAVAAGGAYHHTRPTPAAAGVPADTTSTE